MSILDNWEQWKDFLGDRLISAQEQGCHNQRLVM